MHTLAFQPLANPNLGTLESNQSLVNEKSLETSLKLPSYYHRDCQCELEHGQTSLMEPRSSRNLIIQLKRFLVPTVFVFVALSGLLAWSCHRASGVRAWEDDSSLIGRAFLETDHLTHTQKGQLLVALINSNLIIFAISIVHIIYGILGGLGVLALCTYLFVKITSGTAFGGK